MPTTDADTTDADTTGGSTDGAGTYIRGSGGIAVDGRRLATVGVWLGLVTLSVLVVLLTVSAATETSTTSRLRAHGVAVDATVTGCVALASGTGITAAGFTCRGEFVLDGRSHREVINGTSVLYPTGSVVHAVVVPGDPSTLATASSVRDAPSAWHAYVTPASLFVALVGGAGAWTYFVRRAGRRTSRESLSSLA